jgi:hypothetical protein
MYNLIVGAMDGTLGTDRLLEVVEDGLEEFVGTRSAPNISRLTALPTLLMPEIGDSRSRQKCVGRQNYSSIQVRPRLAVPL